MTAQRLVERSLRVWRDRVAVIDGERRETYATLAERSGRLANVLLGAGAGADKPAATLLPNMLEFVEVDVACARAGITRLGISERLSSEECRYLLADSEAAVLVASRSLFETLADELPDSVRLVLIVGDDDARDGTVPYERALTTASSSFTGPQLAPETPNYILYTSGTTGRPKGATHTHGGRAASTLNMLASELVVWPGLRDGARRPAHARQRFEVDLVPRGGRRERDPAANSRRTRSPALSSTTEAHTPSSCRR